MQGLFSENGPISFTGNLSTPIPNPYSWTKLANVLYIDQPVGTGYSTGSSQATDNNQVVQEFYAWLKSFYNVFPSLKTNNTYLMGESYAGIYIPYFAQAIVQNQSVLPINLKSITIGDGTTGNDATMSDVTITPWLYQHNSILSIPKDVLSVFDVADQQCGFTSVLDQLSYPPLGKVTIPSNPEGDNFRLRKRQGVSPPSEANNTCIQNPITPAQVNASINAPCYDTCATWTTATNYLLTKYPCFSPYNILYNCTSTPSAAPPTTYLNLPALRTAIHAPNKTFILCNATIEKTLEAQSVVPPAYSILPNLLDQGLKVHLYSGDLDLLVNYLGTEAVLQNMTWRGSQGFTFPPTRPFLVDGAVVGNWGYEVRYPPTPIPYSQSLSSSTRLVFSFFQLPAVLK
ncbi:hypothetical protein MMC20_000659 [Loxospora ochrophaea]|nr:hypothetical protein [Loxospora ochrophaea]